VAGELYLASVDARGAVTLGAPRRHGAKQITGWISNLDGIREGFSDDREPVAYMQKNSGAGFCVTGNRRWRQAALTCRYKIHAADRAGFIFNYQGTQRYYAVLCTKTATQIVRQFYGETVLATGAFTLAEDQVYGVQAAYADGEISLHVDGQKILAVTDTQLTRGGAGFFIENGMCGYGALTLTAQSEDLTWEN
jgi:hypothetical protein